MRLEIVVLRKKNQPKKFWIGKKKFGRKKKLTEKKVARNFFRVRKKFGRIFFGRSKKKWSKFFSDSKKFSAEKKKLTEKKIGRKFCWSVEKKSWKNRKFVNFGVSLTFFVVDHSVRARAKRVSTVILNSILLVDSREVDREKCAPASRGLEFLSRVYTRRKSSAWCNNKPSLRSGIKLLSVGRRICFQWLLNIVMML